MKWSAALIALVTVMVFAGEVRAKGQATTSQKEKSARAKSVNLDDIELDDDAPKAAKPVEDKAAAATTTPAAVPVDDKISDAMKATLDQAEALEKAKDFAGVVKLLRPSFESLPRRGLLMISRAYKALNDAPNEVRALESVTAKNPKDYVAQTQLGEAYLRAKRFDDAGHAFQAAMTLNNRYRPAFDGMWTLLETSDTKYEARTLVLDMVKTFGPDAKTSSALCRMYATEDFLEKTTEACRLAIKLDPKRADNYVHLATSLRDQEQQEESVKIIVDAAKRFPDSEDVQSLAGEMKANDRNFAEAYRYYKQAVASDPKSARAQVGFANAAFEVQKHDEAMAAYKLACKLDRKTGRDFRAAFLKVKNNKDPRWLKWQTALEDCN